jgi:hypothetical protein
MTDPAVESMQAVPTVPDDELNQLVEHLQAEEVHAEDARLSSVESLQAWISEHPALRQMHVFEHMHQFGPALLEVVKRLLGI